MTTTSPSSSSESPGARPRRLERSREDRWITGVCGGLGTHLGIDPVIVRLAVVALVFAGGVGIVAYIAAFLIVPEEGAAEPILRAGLRGRGDRPWVIAGAVLLGIGALALVETVTPGWGDGVFWSLALIGVGGYLLLRYTDLGRSLGIDVGGKGRPASPAATQREPATGPTTPLDPATGPTTPLDPATGPMATTAAASQPRRRRRRATGLALGGVLLIVGAAGALLAAGAYDLRPETFIAGAVIVTGLALVASAWFGGAPALIWLGLGTAAVLGVLTTANVRLAGGVGERLYEPARAAALKPKYELGVGQLWVDLRRTELPAGTTNLDANLGAGELTIVVPDDVQVRAKGSAGVGNVLLLGRRDDGTGVERTITDTPPRPAKAKGPIRRLVIDGEVGMGDLRIYRGAGAPLPSSRGFDRGGGGIVTTAGFAGPFGALGGGR